MEMLAMGGWDWALLIVAGFISIGIVQKSKLPNWAMIPITPAVWLASYFVIWVFGVVWALLPFILIGAIIYGVMVYAKKKKA